MNNGLSTCIGFETGWRLFLPEEAEGSLKTGPLSREERAGLSQQKRLVLLVEDNLADVLVIQDAIEQHGLSIELHTVDDGELACEFVARAENDPEIPCPDLLLLDLNLPKRSGKEVLHCVRQSNKCKDVPVLIITSSDLSKDRDELAILGANRYFRKPSSYEQFLKIGEILKDILKEKAN